MNANNTPNTPDPAASMSLLTQLLKNPLDAGYYQYGDTDQQHAIWQKGIAFLLSIILGVAAVSAITNLRSPSRLDVEDSLGEQVEKKHEVVEALTSEVDQLRDGVDSKSQVDTSDAGTFDASVTIATSTSELKGAGLRITVSETPRVGVETGGDRRQESKVRDHDLRMIVNALWAGDAEAIAINGIRIGPGSFIRTAGQSILVNITPVQAPYTIDAIGDPQALSLATVQGETGDYLSSVESAHGIRISTQAVPELRLPAVKPRATRHTQPMEK